MFFDNDLSSCIIIVLGSKCEGVGGAGPARTALLGRGGGGVGSLCMTREDRAFAQELFPGPPEMCRILCRLGMLDRPAAEPA